MASICSALSNTGFAFEIINTSIYLFVVIILFAISATSIPIIAFIAILISLYDQHHEISEIIHQKNDFS